MLFESLPPNINKQTSALYGAVCAEALDSPSMSRLPANDSAESAPLCCRNFRREKIVGPLMSDLHLVLRRDCDQVKGHSQAIDQLLMRVRRSERCAGDGVHDLHALSRW